MKAGAESGASDTTLPQSWSESIVGWLSARVILTSKIGAKLAAEIIDALSIEVGGG